MKAATSSADEPCCWRLAVLVSPVSIVPLSSSSVGWYGYLTIVTCVTVCLYPSHSQTYSHAFDLKMARGSACIPHEPAARLWRTTKAREKKKIFLCSPSSDRRLSLVQSSNWGLFRPCDMPRPSHWCAGSLSTRLHPPDSCFPLQKPRCRLVQPGDSRLLLLGSLTLNWIAAGYM